MRQTLTLAAILSVSMSSHEDASTALGSRTFTSQALDLAVGVNTVVLEHCHLDLLALVLDLLCK